VTPNAAQRLEGLAIFVSALWLYGQTGRSWWIYTIAATAPDLSMAGYLFGKRVGASIYNLAHLLVWPVALGTAGVLQDSSVLVAVALGWASHIGIDRVFGYGFKYASGFKDTHLGTKNP
jgi:hypothetical protein